MGGGTSNLSSAQIGTISKQLQEKYDELQFQGKSNEEMQKILTEMYAHSVTEKSIGEAPKKIGISPAAINKKLTNGSGKLGANSTKSTRSVSTKGSNPPTRRRSFDVKKLPVSVSEPTLPASEAVVAVPETVEDSVVNPPSDVVDSWDSVSQQPFCKTCQMGFKSMPFLERHVKYSDIHQRNLKAVDAPKPAPTTSDPEFTLPISGFIGTTASTKLNPKQVEGEHYKLIYSGSKFFWRTQETVDIDIYHHVLPHTVEVISYDLVKSKEMSRIYLNATLMNDMIKASGVQMTDEDVTRSGITTYLLQRLQLSKTKESLNSISFVPLSGDSTTIKSPVLDKAPLMLIPVPVVRRRRTNAEEIDATISSLASDRQALVAATGMAEKVANLVYASASSIAAKKWWSDFNPVRKRWIWAIRRVIRQKLVAETKAILAAKVQASENSRKGSPKRQTLSRVGSQSKEV